MIKYIDWKIKIPFTKYSLQQYTYTHGNFVNSDMTDVIKSRKMKPLNPIL